MKEDKKSIGEESLALHKKFKGKLAVVSKVPVKNKHDLAVVYTPGVGAVSSYIAKNEVEANKYTIRGNSIAVISDGSAVLGLGNIGPLGALPVMEGKCVLFKNFAGIDAMPIVLGTQDTEGIIRTIKNISPGFGGINLEDISAPRCFEIEERLKNELKIPVMHDDQHGTAIIVLAGLLNALKVVGKNIKNIKIVISGAGAAGTAITNIILREGAKNVIVSDRSGAIYRGREGLSLEKQRLAERTNPDDEKGGLKDALINADVFIGVSSANLVSEEMVRSMAKEPIVFALANPTPEIMPDVAKKGGAKIIATGRSDHPNQLNNALVFPGVFRGALDNKVRKITDEMKQKAAYAIAKLIPHPKFDRIVPDIFDPRLVKAVAKAIKEK